MGRGLVRLDADDLKRLQAVPGDVLQIAGRRATVARAAQAPSSHCGQLLVLIDGTTRGNAQIGVDDWVTVRKVPFKAADSLLLATVQAAQSAPTEEEIPHLRQRLSGIPIVPGDHLQVAFLGARPRSFTVEGTAAAGTLRPRNRHRRSGPRRAPPDTGHSFAPHAARTRRRPGTDRGDHARLRRRGSGGVVQGGGDGGLAPPARGPGGCATASHFLAAAFTGSLTAWTVANSTL